MLFYYSDDRAADYYSVSVFGDPGYLLRRRYAEPNAYGEPGMMLDLRSQVLEGIIHVRPDACNACHGDEINETARLFRNEADPLPGARRGKQEDEVESRLVRVDFQFASFFGRHVDGKHSVRTGPGGVAQQRAEPGLIATIYLHYESRAGDPMLHEHAVISPRVKGPDGRWRNLDSRLLLRDVVAASELFNTDIGDLLGRFLGWALRARRRRCGGAETPGLPGARAPGRPGRRAV